MFERLLFEAEVFIVMHITPGTESNKLKKKIRKSLNIIAKTVWVSHGIL